MSARPISLVPRRLPLTACLTAVLGLALSSAEAGLPQHVMRQPVRRAAALPQPTLPFAQLASVLKQGSLPPGNPSATLHHVTSCSDDANDPGSLRNILADPTTVSGDGIDFAQLPMMCSTITLDAANGALKVSQDTLYLNGPGAANLTIDANDGSPVFDHSGFGTLYVSNLTIANGQYSGPSAPIGGCIFAHNLFLFESVVTHCNVTSTDANIWASGGGVYARGNLTLVRSTISDSGASGMKAAGGGAHVYGNFSSHDSTISGNWAGVIGATRKYGGGVYVYGDVADIEGSTISGNASGYGAGLDLYVRTGAVVLNSTISGNFASQSVGGILIWGPLTLANSTVAFNHAASGTGAGTGLYSNASYPLTLQSSIIANNSGPNGTTDLSGDPGTPVTATGNLVFSSTLPLGVGNIVGVCPMLDPLADNGGLTRTHGLNHMSPAIDNGDASNFTTDQRGAPRPSGAAADIGAVEWQPTDVDERILASGFDGFCDQ